MNKWSNYGKWRHPEKRNQLMKNMDNKDRQKLVKKWESSGLLDNIKGECKIDIVNLLESNATQLLKD